MASLFKRGRTWYYTYIDYSDGRKRRVTKSAKTGDRTAAQRIANKLEGDAALRRDGVIDPVQEAIANESQRPLEEHLKDYAAYLRAEKSDTEAYINRTINVIRKIAAFCRFTKAGDISNDAVNRYLNKMQAEGRAARTRQSHRRAIKGLAIWLHGQQKLPFNPLPKATGLDPKSDRRRERRFLLSEEWAWLRYGTLAAREQYGMPGHERVLLYATAIQTGLRAGELRSLTRGSLFLDGETPYILCKAGTAKNGKQAKQYITPDLAAELQALVAMKAPRAPVFNMPVERDTADMLRDDLAAARDAWLAEAKGDVQRIAQRQGSDFLTAEDHEGKLIDFHALRHTCGVWAALAGASPKEVQTLMRHSTITLTMDTYGHLFPGQESQTVRRLPSMLQPLEAEAIRATGTDDHTAGSPSLAQRICSAPDTKPCVPDARACDDGPAGGENRPSHKSLRVADLRDSLRDNAAENECRRRDSNPHRGYPPGDFKSPGFSVAGIFSRRDFQSPEFSVAGIFSCRNFQPNISSIGVGSSSTGDGRP